MSEVDILLAQLIQFAQVRVYTSVQFTLRWYKWFKVHLKQTSHSVLLGLIMDILTHIRAGIRYLYARRGYICLWS